MKCPVPVPEYLGTWPSWAGLCVAREAAISAPWMMTSALNILVASSTSSPHHYQAPGRHTNLLHCG
jgi:hypothetical protein